MGHLIIIAYFFALAAILLFSTTSTSSSETKTIGVAIFFSSAFFSFIFFYFYPLVSAGQGQIRRNSDRLGVNYGRLGDNLPSPTRVVKLLESQGLKRMKIFDADESVLRAFSGSEIKVIVSVPNDQLVSISQDQNIANQWVEKNIVAYYPTTEIIAIAVGHQVFHGGPNDITEHLVSAMTNVHTALKKNELEFRIKVSSPMAYTAMHKSYPPSKGSFKKELIEPVIKPMLDFLRQTGSYLMMNIYPFFAYRDNPDYISLAYATFRENKGVIDSENGLHYFSLFDAQVDAVYAAMSVLGYGDLKMVVTESGWPSKGDEIGAGALNAAAYNGNLVEKVLRGRGTPLKPNDALDVYLFALFNENQKPDSISEKNFGLFFPNENHVYQIPFLRESEAK